MTNNKQTFQLALPDAGIQIRLWKNDCEGDSVEVLLNTEVCNTAFSYHDGELVRDEDFHGGIYDEVKAYLTTHGFLSPEHWECEETTATHDDGDLGYDVSVDFFYKDRPAFTRRVRHAYPSENDRLLRAVEGLLGEKSLSGFINLPAIDDAAKPPREKPVAIEAGTNQVIVQYYSQTPAHIGTFFVVLTPDQIIYDAEGTCTRPWSKEDFDAFLRKVTEQKWKMRSEEIPFPPYAYDESPASLTVSFYNAYGCYQQVCIKTIGSRTFGNLLGSINDIRRFLTDNIPGLHRPASSEETPHPPVSPLEEISFFVFPREGAMIAYHGGQVYYIDERQKRDIMDTCPATLSLTPFPMAFADFIQQYKSQIRTGWNIISYRSFEGFREMNRLLKYRFLTRPNCRFRHESHLMAFAEALCSHPEAEYNNEEVYRIIYQGMQCSFEYGGGVCDILGTGCVVGGGADVHTIRLTDAEALSRLVVGAVITFGVKYKLFTRVDAVLLNSLAFPLRIYGTTRRDDEQEVYIPADMPTPHKESNELDLSTYQEGDLMLEADNRRYPLRLRDHLGYYPAKIRATVDTDVNGNILISLFDEEFHKEVTIAYFDLE